LSLYAVIVLPAIRIATFRPCTIATQMTRRPAKIKNLSKDG